VSTRKKKPYALKAADDLDGMWLHSHAAELRRLHEVNAELLERLKVVAWTLNLVHPYGVPEFLHEGSAFRKSIIAAIARAEEVKP
jgi:hypothetical protein